MRLNLDGAVFNNIKHKPHIPAYQFKEIKQEGGKKRYVIKKNLHNLYVYLYVSFYVGKIYPTLCRFVFPLSFAFNRLVVRLLRFLSRSGALDLLFNFLYFFYSCVLIFLSRYLFNINLLRFVCYLPMVHLNFRNFDCWFRDLVARRLKLTVNNEQHFIDWFQGILINSYMYYDMTDMRFTYWSEKKKKFLSFFLLYEEKARTEISNKYFLENFFSLLESFAENRTDQIRAHKNFCRSRFGFYFSLLQRPSLTTFWRLVFFWATKAMKIFLLLVVLPLFSFSFQIVLPFLRAFLTFFLWVLLFLKELFLAIFFVIGFGLSLFGHFWDFLIIFFWFIFNRIGSYQKLISRLAQREAKSDERAIKFLKIVLTPFYRVYELLPSSGTLKKFFVDEIIKRTITPTLLNGDDGFLFVHRQMSRYNGKYRYRMDQALMDYLVSRQEFKYWEFDVEDDLGQREEKAIERYFTSGSIYLQMLEQDETDEDEDEDEDIDFWLLFNNSNDYDVVSDLEALCNSFYGFLFDFPGTRYLVIYLSALCRYPVLLHRRWLQGFAWWDEKCKDQDLEDFSWDWNQKSYNIHQWWYVAPGALFFTTLLTFNGTVMQKAPFNLQFVNFNVWGYACPSLFLFLLGYAYFMLGMVYAAEHMVNQDMELYVSELEDTSNFYEDDQSAEEYMIDLWLLCFINFWWASAAVAQVSYHRYLSSLKIYRNQNSVDIVSKVEDWCHIYATNLGSYLEHLASFFIN